MKTISALWKKQLPPAVRAAIAGMDLAKDFDNVLRKADDVHASQAVQQFPVAAVAAANVDLDETQPALQVAAFAPKKPAAKQQQQNFKSRVTPPPRWAARHGLLPSLALWALSLHMQEKVYMPVEEFHQTKAHKQCLRQPV